MKTTRAERRGKEKTIFNELSKRFEVYRLSKRGVWIMKNNITAPHLSHYEMYKLETQDERPKETFKK